MAKGQGPDARTGAVMTPQPTINKEKSVIPPLFEYHEYKNKGEKT